MGKPSKSTKKFQKTKLKGVIKKRKEDQQKKKHFQHKQALRTRRSEERTEKKNEKFEKRKQEEEEIDDAETFGDEDSVDASLYQDIESFLENLPQASDDEEDDDHSSVLSSNDEDQQQEPPTSNSSTVGSGPNAKLEEQVLAHRQELEKLKEADPEFFEFLQKEDAELLEFGQDQDAFDSDEELEDADEKLRAPRKDSKLKTTDPVELTKELIDELVENVLASKSNKAIKKLVVAYKSACNFCQENQQQDFPFKVTSSEVYNHLMLAGICKFPQLFHFLFDIQEEHIKEELQLHDSTTKKKTKYVRLPSRIYKHERWSNLSSCVKSYLNNTIVLLEQTTDSKILNFVLKRFDQSFLVYFSCIPLMANKLLKTLLNLWSSSEESCRVLAYLAIRELTILTPYPFIDNAIKSLYLTFVKNSKFTNRNTLGLIQFMSNCVVELIGLDFKVSYQHAFSYIRVLAVKLRNAILSKTKEQFSMIYGWQYYHSLNLWTEVLCSYSEQPDLQLLIYPLVQVISGAVQLLPGQKYYPFHFLCIRMLHRLAAATRLFVPTLPFMIRILEAPEFTKKLKPSTEKPMDWQCNIRVPNALLHTRILFDGVVEQLFELILEHLNLYSYSISFPEFAFPIIMTLKHFIKTTKIPEYSKSFKQLVQQIENGCNFIKTHRNKVDYAPKDVEKADHFLQDLKNEHKQPLDKYYIQQKELQERNRKSDTIGEIFEMNE